MRFRRPWPFQNWVKHDFGYGPLTVVAHSRLLGRLGRCKCMGCVMDRVERRQGAA